MSKCHRLTTTNASARVGFLADLAMTGTKPTTLGTAWDHRYAHAGCSVAGTRALRAFKADLSQVTNIFVCGCTGEKGRAMPMSQGFLHPIHVIR